MSVMMIVDFRISSKSDTLRLVEKRVNTYNTITEMMEALRLAEIHGQVEPLSLVVLRGGKLVPDYKITLRKVIKYGRLPRPQIKGVLKVIKDLNKKWKNHIVSGFKFYLEYVCNAGIVVRVSHIRHRHAYEIDSYGRTNRWHTSGE